MTHLKIIRKERKVSQRNLASQAGIAYKTLQLIESGRHDPKVSTLERLAQAMGYPSAILENQIDKLFQNPPDSVFVISQRIFSEGENSWKLWLFNFVDAFRFTKNLNLIQHPPIEETSLRMKALLASAVEVLCIELELPIPDWCESVPGLEGPWFLSGMENLKSLALVQSPTRFRKRNIFVLDNFLERI